MFAELLVVLAAGVFVAEKNGERSTRRMALVHAGNNFREVGLHTRRGSQRPGLSAEKVLSEIFLTERNARQDTVQGYTDALPVGFAKNAYAKFIAKGIHSSLFLRYTRFARYDKRTTRYDKSIK